MYKLKIVLSKEVSLYSVFFSFNEIFIFDTPSISIFIESAEPLELFISSKLRFYSPSFANSVS